MKAEKLPTPVDTAPVDTAPVDTAPVEAGGFKLVGLDPAAQEVYFPETARSYVLAEMTACQLEQLHRLGSKHVDKIPA